MRHGSENIHLFEQDTFSVRLDVETNIKYVTKEKDEMMKNHKETSTDLVTGVMPEIPGSKYCPVRSFEIYLQHLNPDCKWLWQKPRTNEELEKRPSEIWYCNMKIGPNPLAAFMSRISRDAKLSKNYTNHCIRVTGCTFLTRNKFAPNQIMAISGHHSLNSLAIYQKVSNNEKLTMGMTMNYFMNTDQPQLNLPQSSGLRAITPKPAANTHNLPSAIRAPPAKRINVDENRNINIHAVPNVPDQRAPHSNQTPLSSITNMQTNAIPSTSYTEPEDPFQEDDNFDNLNFDLIKYVADLENDTEQIEFSTQQKAMMPDHQVCTTMRSVQRTVKTSPNIPMFNNCKIGEIHFHIEKK